MVVKIVCVCMCVYMCNSSLTVLCMHTCTLCKRFMYISRKDNIVIIIKGEITGTLYYYAGCRVVMEDDGAGAAASSNNMRRSLRNAQLLVADVHVSALLMTEGQCKLHKHV